MRVNPNDLPANATSDQAGTEALSPLLQAPARAVAEDAVSRAAHPVTIGVVVGQLLAISANDAKTPLVGFGLAVAGAAVPARTTVDLHGAHIGRDVVLMFEHGDPKRPIVIGVLQGPAGWPADEAPAQVQVDADGQRLLVSAREQLVLRCGKASITLTKAGKVLIEGSYLLSRASGVNRIKGGSVQLN